MSRKLFNRALPALDTNVENCDWLHCVDVREIGTDFPEMTSAVREAQVNKLFSDTSANYTEYCDKYCSTIEQTKLGQSDSAEAKKKKNGGKHGWEDGDSVPSLESFFGQVGEILLYSPHVKCRYAPFL